jgi:starch phosphorylase
MRPTHHFHVEPAIPERLAALRPLAENLHWCWDRHTADLFDRLDPHAGTSSAWQRTGRHPLQLVLATTASRWDELATDDGFAERVDAARRRLDAATAGPSWFAERDGSPLGLVAYFSPEFGITEAIQQYSGGLGVLAGDHLKASSDLGVPLVGVGLLYAEGYFHQLLDGDGWQQERNDRVVPGSLGMRPTGIEVSVDLAGTEARLAVWRVDVGRIALYLLDADVDGNPPEVVAVTNRLYGGDEQHRLRQEIVLGIGGVRALRALGLAPDVFHTNEGHAGFLGFERVREFIEQGLSKDEAIEATRAGSVFTTHTPVPAGIDRFPKEMFDEYFDGFAASCGLAVDELFEIGRRDDEPDGKFNMAVMGLRLAARSNGVARLHGAVSRQMFGGLWPDLPPADAPIGHVTNGVHARSWVSGRLDELLTDVIGDRWHLGGPDDWARVHDIDRMHVWSVRDAGRRELVDLVRERMGDDVLDPDALTIGFARRFATYKRATLLLSQPDRLLALLGDDERPVQFVFAGKAHPADTPGKELIQAIERFSRRPEARRRFVFLPDYDIGIARTMYHGCDVWLNTPRRPMEACGTSGMKAALNGALNLSIRDGWWDEMSDGTNGYDIASFDDDPDDGRRDRREANATFELIERELVPTFHDRGDSGLPHLWLDRVLANWSSLGWQVVASRMVRQYVTDLYEPAAAAARLAIDEGAAVARDVAAWRRELPARFASVTVRIDVSDSDLGDGPNGRARPVVVDVDAGALAPDELRVQLVHGPLDPSGAIDDSLRAVVDLDRGDDGRYRGELHADAAGPWGVVARALPHHRGLASVFDTGLVASG